MAIRRKLRVEEKDLTQHTTALQRARVEEKKNILHRKLITWQEAQLMHIPALVTIRRSTSGAEDEFDLENVDLGLPSSLGNRIDWDKQLGEYEWQLRQAQGHDALNDLRQNLR